MTVPSVSPVLQPDYFPAARALARTLLDSQALALRPRPVVAIAGESCSGKSVTADCLAIELAAAGLPTVVVHQDHYFRLPPRTNHAHRCEDLAHVGPHEVRLDLLAEHVAAFRAARDGVVAPFVDYPNDRFLEQTYDFSTAEVLVVEGTYALMLPDLDVRVFLTATHEETEARRRARARDIEAPIIAQVLAIEHRLIAPQRERADLLLDLGFAITRR